MAKRDQVVASSIESALSQHDNKHHSLFSRLPKWFSAYWLDFDRVSPDTFRSLRREWHIEDDAYRKSFTSQEEPGNVLESMGDMGFSGSTFFTTHDSLYLIKSIPRGFEYSSFRDDLLEPYANHMRANLASLLIRITDFLENSQSTLGTSLGLAPSHHIVMENIKFGQSENEDKHADKDARWESYDLKPLSYFYPERDVAKGAFATEDALDKLADEFHDRLSLSLDNAEEFKAQLEKDTALLARCNAVDYSLFLVRIPVAAADHNVNRSAKYHRVEVPIPPAQPPFTPPNPPSWRVGVKSADGKWFYRAAVLDFFWTKHKPTAQLMTGLIKTYNVLDKQGPMSITTNAKEYRERFLKMCSEMIEVKDD